MLVVEDDAFVGHLIELQLEAAWAGDLAIKHVRTWTSAQRVLFRGPVDCVVLDLGLPDVGGIELIERVCAAQPGTAVVVYSGHADEALAEAALRAGAEEYLVKGRVSGDRLAHAVRGAIRARKASRRG